MGVVSSMYTAVTGLRAHGQALGVTANNIANASTNGFKHSRAEFQDLMSKSLRGIFGGNQIGRGAKVSAVHEVLTQGNLENTDRSTDVAIQGRGYFIVDGFDGRSYTRNGEFEFDKDGFLITSDHYRVQGFQANRDGQITNLLEDIQIPDAIVPAITTRTVKMDLNLDARVPSGRVFNAQDPYNSADYTTGVEVYDSQGAKHLITMAFNKVQPGVWEWRGLANGSEVEGGRPGEYTEVAGGRVGFTPDGVLNTEELLNLSINFAGGAAPDQQIAFDFGDSLTTDGGTGIRGTKQYGSPSDLQAWSQDGSAAGQIVGLSFDDTGILTAMYDNGTTRDLAQIAIAKFDAPEALFKAGNNKLKQSRDSGESAIGRPTLGGRGQIYAKSIERSTVDIANEFVNMIQYQRNFQANAKQITTSDEMLADVIAMKR